MFCCFICIKFIQIQTVKNTLNYILESELVSGFMTEHAAVIFVFFFLAEYASIVLICILTSILFLGGYLYNYLPLFSLIQYIDFEYYINNLHNESLFLDPLVEGLLYGLSLGIKSSIMIFIFIWVRASFPRIRFDQLMSFCWTVLLPVIIAFIILVPCLLYSFDIIPSNISLL
jgi:NADH-ubiquinone oxidoreductase chain 1